MLKPLLNPRIQYFDGTVSDILNNCQGTVESKIPPILHFVWVGPNNMSDETLKLFNQWKTITKLEIRLWTNEDLTTEEFSPEILKKINQSKKPAQKADIIRLAVLYKYGGIYLDIDMRPIRDLEPLLSYFNQADGIICNDEPNFDGTNHYLCNAFIACRPGSRLAKNALELILLGDFDKCESIIELTGPVMFGRSLCLGLEDENIVCLPAPFFFPISWRNPHSITNSKLGPEAESNCFAQHLWFKSWW
jgi:hypothetical protein